MRSGTRFFASFFLGFASLLSQVVLIREMMSVFMGNELTAGLLLAGWLFWVGLGSIAAGRLTRWPRFVSPVSLALLQVAMGFLVPFTLAAVRSLPSLAAVTPGETMPLGTILLGAGLLPSLLGLSIGLQFSLLVGLISRERALPGGASRLVYLLESAGASLAGFLFAFLLAGRLPAMVLALLLAVVAVGSGAMGLLPPTLGKKARRWATATAALVTLAAAAAALVTLPSLEVSTRMAGWPGFELVGARETVYGSIVVTRLGEQYNFYQNGVFSFASPDPLTSEEAVHLPMAVKGRAGRVLVLGGCVSGVLREILKHPVKSVDCVELDPGLVALAGGYLSPDDTAALSDTRITVHYQDPRAFVMAVRGPYDLILMYLPEPENALINRMYTVEFFRDVRRILDERGLFSFGLTSPANYLGRDFLLRNGSIFRSLKDVFPGVTATAGERSIFFASPSPDVVSLDQDRIRMNLEAAAPDNIYVTPVTVAAWLPGDRIAEINAALASAPGRLINRDARPIAYLLHLDVWLGLLLGTDRISLGALADPAPAFWFIPAGVFLLLAFAPRLFLPRTGYRRWVAGVTMAASGFAGIALEIIILYAFQVSHGHLFQEIGALLALVMAGLAAGSFISGRIGPGRGRAAVLAAEAGFLLLALAAAALFSRTGGVPLQGSAGRAVYYLSALIVGCLGGLEFPLLVTGVQRGAEEGAGSGLVYGLDLLGSCLGAALVSLLAVPLLGLAGSALLVAGVKGVTAAACLSAGLGGE